ncbi:MAG TPA: hypothetical protein PK027_01375 [Aquimonas sp.]|nr:hypothetical protein [Aquimonas sp.]HRF53096.1 hypothetical protein [Aquimonas sp.]
MNRSEFSSSDDSSEAMDRLIRQAVQHYEPVPLPVNFSSETAAFVLRTERNEKREAWFLFASLLLSVAVALWFDASWLSEFDLVWEAFARLGGGQAWLLVILALTTAWCVDQGLSVAGGRRQA